MRMAVPLVALICLAAVGYLLVSHGPEEPERVTVHLPIPNQYVQEFDSSGKVVRQGWTYDAPPDRFEKDGLSHLQPYVQDLLASKNWYSTVAVFTFDQGKYFGLTKMDGAVSVDLMIDTAKDPDLEARARSFFKKMAYAQRTTILPAGHVFSNGQSRATPQS